jgi:hypothetical protein
MAGYLMAVTGYFVWILNAIFGGHFVLAIPNSDRIPNAIPKMTAIPFKNRFLNGPAIKWPGPDIFSLA